MNSKLQPDATELLEAAIASKLETLDVKVRRFADEFAKTGKPAQGGVVLVGHSGSEYQWATEAPVQAGLEIASFEIRCEIADLKVHTSALRYLASAMDSLTGFQPYTGIRPVVPVRYAPVGYNNATGIWSYSGIVRAAISKPWTEHELIEDLPAITTVQLGIWREGYLQRHIDISMTEA